jgi:hypothetical protein
MLAPEEAMILKSETYHFHRLDLMRQAGFIVTVYEENFVPPEGFHETIKLILRF